jgi:hypothetical protein
MKLTRRAFFEGLAAAIATVAIASRMAPKFLPDNLMGGSWRWEQANDKYFYGIDTANPWDVTVFEKVYVDAEGDLVREIILPSEVWKEIDPAQLARKANESIEDVVEYRISADVSLEYDAVATIAMSQSVLAIKNQDGDMRQAGYIGMQEMSDLDVMPLPAIHLTRENLFRHV